MESEGQKYLTFLVTLEKVTEPNPVWLIEINFTGSNCIWGLLSTDRILHVVGGLEFLFLQTAYWV